ncbi:glycosyltransferase [Nitrosomonas sp. Is37]|uniref:glycosyltransferase n=1 Tax=Nitrosomonas sp. Is37 TaxID=3080535 RepID=UPI00294AE6DE|nr:glycosyltransferase [Nitrosomonas sp. Is37]MDV6344900.1 glycosyltransferase [Nitrosomonas sp. Is37]
MSFIKNKKENNKPQLVIFSPMPPVENGIADYCAELLPGLSNEYEVILVIDNHVPPPVISSEIKYLHLAQYLYLENEFIDVPHLYHIGNNPDHEYLIPVLLKRPGILVLHDISLHYLVDQMTLRWGDVETYCKLLEYEYGNLGRILAEQFRLYRLRERTMFYELPMIRLIASRSRAIIVHSWYGKTKVLAQEPEVPVEIIRHHLAHSAIFADKNLDKKAARNFIGVDQDELLLVSLGFITKAKQIDTVLEVLARCRNRLPKFRYILAGQDQPEQYDIRAAINAYGLEDVVEVTGYLEEDDFYVYSIAADIVINLRYPTGGETSGTLIRALGVGACVMVVKIGPFTEFPEEVCVQLPWSESFDITFMNALLSLAAQPRRRLKIGAAAKKHVQTHHALSASCAAYCRIIKDYSNRPVLPWQSSQTFEYATLSTREKILDRFTLLDKKNLPLWFREMQLPLATPRNQLQTILFGEARSKQLLCNYLGYDSASIRIEPPVLSSLSVGSIPRRSFALAILEPKNFPIEDEWHVWLTEINRIMQLNGVLLISASASWPEPSSALRKQVMQKLQQTGFRLLRYLSSPQDISFTLDIQKNDMVVLDETPYYPCWLATKISEFIDPIMPKLIAPQPQNYVAI